jgi:hypothetical protein
MRLSAPEFMRRFLLHVLPAGFHRIHHYGLLANAGRRQDLERARALLHEDRAAESAAEVALPHAPTQPTFVCGHCGTPMVVVEILERGSLIRAPPRQHPVP